VSHPIPLHTAGKLERALAASSRFVAARGPKGLVMRIVAYFACQYCEAVIGLLEGLLAEYRAGTLVLPGIVDDPSTAAPADRDTAKPRTAPRRARVPATRRMRAPREPNAAPRVVQVRYRPDFIVGRECCPARPPKHGPRGVAGYPSVVPRWPVEKFSNLDIARSHVHFVTISERPSRPAASARHSAAINALANTSPVLPSVMPTSVTCGPGLHASDAPTTALNTR
jgi:hypothetical protein